MLLIHLISLQFPLSHAITTVVVILAFRSRLYVSLAFHVPLFPRIHSIYWKRILVVKDVMRFGGGGDNQNRSKLMMPERMKNFSILHSSLLEIW